MFRSAVTKLTIQYLLIIMLISSFFSINLYLISANEIDRSLAKQQKFFQVQGNSMMQNPFDDTAMQVEHQKQLEISKQNVIYQLIYTNIAILFLAGGLSYLLARWTIKPIEEAHEKQKRFTSDASHELRTPLAAMKAEIEVNLRDQNSNKEDLTNVLESNLEEVEKMQRLVSGLLSLARDDGGKLELTDFSAHEIVEDACTKFRKIQGAKVENLVDKNLSLRADRTYFSELISILVDNAVKYSTDKVSVIVRSVPHNKQVEIQVADKGIGIEEKNLPYIFDRFYRVDNSRTKNHVDGYGLGLPLAKKIVELHKGEISVSSKLGEGTTFTVKIPQ